MSTILFEDSWIQKESHVGKVVVDLRGSHEPRHKMSAGTVKAIVTHIEYFHPAISHYRRKHAPLRRYLPPTLNVRKMYELFQESVTTEIVSYQGYRRVFKKQNIAFTKLGEEEYEECETFKQHKCQGKKKC